MAYYTKSKLYEKIQSTKQYMRIKETDYPLNIFELCSITTNVIIKSVDFSSQRLRGMVYITKSKKENHIILVNKNKSFEEQNYHGSHEFCHILTVDSSKSIKIECYDSNLPKQDPYIEWLANEGAAELLVPYKQLLPLIKKNYNNLIQGFGTFDFCHKIAPSFLVTPTVIENRLNSLSYEIEQYINGVPLDKIQILSKTQQRKRNIYVKSLNDLENDRITHFKSNNIA